MSGTKTIESSVDFHKVEVTPTYYVKYGDYLQLLEHAAVLEATLSRLGYSNTQLQGMDKNKLAESWED